MLELFEGYQWRDEHEWIRQAWVAASVINGTGNRKRPVDPIKMLKGIIPERKPKGFVKKSDQPLELNKLRSELNAKNDN